MYIVHNTCTVLIFRQFREFVTESGIRYRYCYYISKEFNSDEKKLIFPLKWSLSNKIKRKLLQKKKRKTQQQKTNPMAKEKPNGSYIIIFFHFAHFTSWSNYYYGFNGFESTSQLQIIARTPFENKSIHRKSVSLFGRKYFKKRQQQFRKKRTGTTSTNNITM